MMQSPLCVSTSRCLSKPLVISNSVRRCGRVNLVISNAASTSSSYNTPSFGPFYLWCPSDDEMKDIQSSIPKRALNFPHVGLTRTTPPLPIDIKSEAWKENCFRFKLGSGVATYNKAVAALKAWQHLDLGWAFIYGKPAVKKDSSVVFTAQSLFLWSCNPLKISYIDEKQKQRYSVGHTTCTGHQLSGEERFTVELDKKDDTVWYEVYSVSKPDNPLVWLAQPLLQIIQMKFANDSAKALKKQTV